jgi:hypothetical protein
MQNKTRYRGRIIARAIFGGEEARRELWLYYFRSYVLVCQVTKVIRLAGGEWRHGDRCEGGHKPGCIWDL